MCVQLRPVIKDDSMLQAVFKVCLKYTSTQKWCQKWDCYKFTTNCVNMLSDYQLELAVNRTG